ncbi:glutamate synthase subunit beta [Lentisphaerota bacterium ZTH]|nr:glutamate synthase subunit beta [Lentisphaerota bacterium]WET07156.1 glutamate synthase subunit beta [Lentisphaerota bacterium ZTH]
MSRPRGFIEIERQNARYRPKEERVKDYNEVEQSLTEDEIVEQSGRCMDCGVPFCHGSGCPLDNVIPEFNELVHERRWQEALDVLLSTNNFPEFTGRICPALCEASCTAGLSVDAVSIRQIELAVIEKGFAEGYIRPCPPPHRSGRKVAVIGSGPAGLAVADQLNKMGHWVTVYERDKFAGGLLRYGIPDFKLNKAIVERRIKLMRDEGVSFETGIDVGVDVTGSFLLKKFDAVCLCNGSRIPRDLPVPGRELDGIHFAMDYLKQQNQRVSGEPVAGKDILAAGKKVVVIGGGDTGSDCVGTAIRQGAESVTQLEIMPRPPEERDEATPWPQWPYKLRTSSSHKEGCQRMWNILTESFSGNGNVQRVNAVKVDWDVIDGRPVNMRQLKDSGFTLNADLVLLAMGFVGAQKYGCADQFGVKLDQRGNVKVDDDGRTSEDRVFAAGDIASGPSLVVRAIDAGRILAETVNDYLK